jgi:GMP synthase (glutamine-hydrolysing)
MDVLVLQHIACEPPGVFEDVLTERGAVIHRVELDEGERLPGTHTAFAAVVAMGGPMSVNDEAAHPWLVDEKRFIRDAVQSGTPFWGSCLGVQLLASSLGSKVSVGEKPEVGVLPVYPTAAAAEDPVFAGITWPRPTLQWHGDTFELPLGATLLATSPAYTQQAFRVGRVAYGVQFHVEVTGEMAQAWADVPEYQASAHAVLGAGGLDALLAEYRLAMPEMLTDARAMFGRWVDLWAPPSRAGVPRPLNA